MVIGRGFLGSGVRSLDECPGFFVSARGKPERAPETPHPMAMKTAIRQAAERLTDTELIQGIQAGDMRALEALMRRHNRTLYRTARAILRDDAEAEDAVQEAYLRAYAALGTFRG